MRTCTNCGSQITCGCQDRIASDGVKVCASCIASYEQELLLMNQIKTHNENVSTE
jgi:hypothetical protein